MQAWLVSDIHLKSINERNAILFGQLLDRLYEDSQVTHFILLGDIFDLWISDGKLFAERFEVLVQKILRLKQRGIEVLYFEGNHDVHVQDFWQDQYGIPTHVNCYLLAWGPYKIRLEHGDLINPEDKAYLRYRSIIRHRVLEHLAPQIVSVLQHPLDVAGRLASQWSRGRSFGNRRVNQEELRKKIRDYAKSSALKSESGSRFDLLVTGHMHVRDDWEFRIGEHKIRSINLGSWFDTPSALRIGEDLACEFVEL